MASRTRRLSCIVLRRTKLAEQDLILTMLAASGEEVRAVAKGARRPGGRLASRSELFSEVDLLLAKGRGTLEIVSEATLVNAHAKIRGDFARVSAASVVAELACLTCLQNSEDPFLHPICSKALACLERACDQRQLDLIVAAYVMKVLAHCGWRPELTQCISCGDTELAYLSVQMGGTLCSSCAKDVPGARRLERAELAWLRALITSTFDELLAAGPDLKTSSALVLLAHVWATTQLDCRLRAYEFMLSS